MKSIKLSSCQVCRHYYQDTSGDLLTCAAFPDGIPDPLLSGEVNHVRSYPGDQGIRFERIRGPQIISREPEEITVGRVNMDINTGDEIIRRGGIDITIRVNPMKELFGDRFT